VAVCLGNLVAALLVLVLIAPASFAPIAPNREWNLSPTAALASFFFPLI
jgi:hypothetical protein